MVQRKSIPDVRSKPLVKHGKRKRMQMLATLRKDLINRKQLRTFKSPVKRPRLTSLRLAAANLDQSYHRSLQKTRSSRTTSAMSTSTGTDESCTSPTDLRKLKILHSLLQMGVQIPPKQNTSKDAQSDEKKVLKYMANSSRRGSLTARTLVSFQRQTSFHSEKSSGDESDFMLPPITMDRKRLASKGRAFSWFQGKQRLDDSTSPEPVRIRRRVKKTKDSHRFKRLAKFVVVFLRAWNIHATRVDEVLGYVDSLQFISNKPKQDLLFDITNYKGTKEASLSMEAKRVLQKRSKDRTPDELRYVQVALGNYKSIAAYPSKMKKLIAKKAWFEEFDAKRVIVREGHVPMGFYFILSGSALVSGMDEENQIAQTILVLTRGDSFGELAMVNRSIRQATVISKEHVEFLVLSTRDFKEIFMASSMRDPTEPFLRTITCFKGWPIGRLTENGDGSKTVMSSYFKRGTVLVKDSLKNDWIFIIKSGSCDVMKTLKMVDISKPVPVKKRTDWRIKLKEESISETITGISHEEKVNVAYQDKVIQLQQIKQRLHNIQLPPLIKDHQQYQKSLKEVNDEKNSRPSQISQGSSKASGDTNSKPVRREASGKLSNIEHLLHKRPYLSSSNSSHPSTIEVRGSDFGGNNNSVTSPVKNISNHFPSKRTETPPDVPVYVNIQNLVRGEVFGVTDLFFEGQARFTLVSRGVECIMINKKFYMQHASHGFLTQLREKMYPYPSEADLQHNLEQRFRWNEHKKEEIYDVINDVQIRKSLERKNRFTLPKIKTY